MDDPEVFLICLQGAISIFIGGCLIYMHLQDRTAKKLARGSKPFPARVVGSKREERDGRRGRMFHVETRFEVPDLGIRVHFATFPTEGKALLHARIHKEGSVHPVVPNLLDNDQVFLASDLREASSWGFAAWGALLVAVGLYAFGSALFSDA